MAFGEFNHTWYRISLDTQNQVFFATSKANPQEMASGITVEEAVHNLENLHNHDYSSTTQPA